MDFPSNSHNIGGGNEPDKPIKEEIVKIVTTEVIHRKPSLGKKVKAIFFNGDFKSAASYIVTDVVVPAIKNTILDSVNRGTERVLFGESASRRSRNNLGMVDPRDPRRSYFSYNSMSRPSTDRYRPGMLPDQPPHMPRNRRPDAGDIVLLSREEAELVLERMMDIIDKYDSVSVADLHDLVGLPTQHTDNKWGWTRLLGVSVKQTREGYLIDLPQAEPI